MPGPSIASRLFRDPRRRFTALVRPHLDIMYRMAFRWTRQQQDAEDLVQDVLLKLVDRLDEMESIDQLRPWLLRILYRRFVDVFRRAQRSPVDYADQHDLEEQGISASSEADIDSVERYEWQQALQLGLDALDDEQRDTILLHDVEGYTAEEVAIILEIRPGTVKSRVHRARSRLKEFLGKELSASFPRVREQKESKHEM